MTTETTPCRECHEPIAIEYQESWQYFDYTVTPRRKLAARVALPSRLSLTCHCVGCKLHLVTVECTSLEEYYTRDLSDKMGINR